jgi:excisionase family DNA binding protein
MTNQKSSEPAMEPLLLTVKDAASCLRLSRARIYVLLQRQVIPIIRIGRSVRISSQALRQYVAELEAEITAEQANKESKRRSVK